MIIPIVKRYGNVISPENHSEKKKRCAPSRIWYTHPVLIINKPFKIGSFFGGFSRHSPQIFLIPVSAEKTCLAADLKNLKKT